MALAPEEREGFRNVLRRRDFRFLWAAQAASQLADKFLMYALLIYTYDQSGRASLQSVLMLAYTLPSVFLSAPAGVFADRHDKRALMLGANVVRGGLILLIPLASVLPGLRGSSLPGIAVAFLFSAAGQVFAPAEAASIPVLVTRDQISAATSLFMTTVIMTLVLGVPAATVANRLLGQQAPFFIAAGLFGVAALCVWQVGANLRNVHPHSGPETRIREELREGLGILRRDPALRLGLAQLALALMVVFTVFALGPAFLAQELHRSDQDTYLVLIPATLGLVATAAILGQRAGSSIARANLLVGALVTGGAAMIAVGLLPRILGPTALAGLLIPLIVGVSAIFGCALGAILIPAFTVLQERTTEESRGRIFGGIFTVINVAVAIPLLAAGIVADAAGPGPVVAALGAMLALSGVAARTLLWDRIRILDAPPEPVNPPFAPI